MRTGQEQTIASLAPVDPNAPNAADLEIIRTEEMKTVAKRKLKLAESFKKGYANMYNQCSNTMKEKLEAKED